MAPDLPLFEGSMRFVTRASVCTFVVVVSAAACRSSGPPDGVDSREHGGKQGETAAAFFDRFPSGDYESFLEAETVTGFHIPRPSADFPNLHGNTTHVQWLPRVSAPVSRTYYGPLPGGPTERSDSYVRHIWVRVAVSGLFSGGDGDMMQGDRIEFGDKDGWLVESDDGVTRLFNYMCGSFGAETLWCTVAGATEIDIDIFSRFVESLE
jgi:hypothetical protein